MRRHELLLALAFVFCAPPAFAQDTNMRTYVDDCYTDTPGFLQCVGWAVGNGFTPAVVHTIGTCGFNCSGTADYSALTFQESRHDVCAVVQHTWGWACDDDDWSACERSLTACVGYRSMLDLRAYPPGRYYTRLTATSVHVTPPVTEGSPYLYVFDWNGTSAAFVTWLDSPFETE